MPMHCNWVKKSWIGDCEWVDLSVCDCGELSKGLKIVNWEFGVKKC